MPQETILSLKESHVHVEMKTDGIHTEKNITYSDISRMFENRSTITSDYLPGEYGVQRFAFKGNRELYLYTEPPRRVETKYSVGGNLHKNQFIVPALAWFVILEKRGSGYRYQGAWVFAMKSSIFTGKEELYTAPFSNVYDNNGICWGNNVVQLPSAKAIQGLSSLFFSAPFNSDLDHDKFDSFNRTYSEGNAYRTIHLQMEINEMLKTKTEQEALDFVEGKLLRAGTTIEDFFNRTLRNI